MRVRGINVLATALMVIILFVSLMPVLARLTDDARDKGWEADIIQYRELIKSTVYRGESHIKLSPSDFVRECNMLISRIKTLDDTALSYELIRINSMLHIAHNMFVIPRPKFYPVTFIYLDDGFYFYSTIEPYMPHLKKKLIKIDGMPIDKAYDTLKNYIAHETDGWAKVMITRQLRNASLLYHCGIAKSTDSCKFTFADDSGETSVVEIKAFRDGENITQKRDLEYDAKLKEKNPLSRLSNDNYYKAYVEEKKVLYINYALCDNMKSKNFARFTEEVMKDWAEKKPDKLIVDVRNNVGGDSSVVWPLVSWARNNADFAKENTLFVLTGPTTFSSGVLCVEDFKFQTNATIVGEPTGGLASCWGMVKSMAFPNSKLKYSYSTGFVGIEDMTAVEPIKPDFEILWRHGDFFNCEDTVINEILAGRLPAKTREPGYITFKKESWKKDLNELQARLILGYPNLGKITNINKITQKLDEIRSSITDLNSMPISLKVSQFMKEMNDPSAVAFLPENPKSFEYWISFGCIEKKLCIIICTNKDKEMFLKEIVKICGLTVDQFVEKLRSYFTFNDKLRFLTQYSRVIMREGFFKALGLAGDDGRLVFTYRDEDGSLKDHVVEKYEIGKSGDDFERYEVPIQCSGKQRYLVYKQESFFEPIDGRLMYLRIVRDKFKPSMEDFLASFEKNMKSGAINRILLDMRQNGFSVDDVDRYESNIRFYELLGDMIKRNPEWNLTIATDFMSANVDIFMAWMLKKTIYARIVGEVPGIRLCNLWKRQSHTTINKLLYFTFPKSRWIDNADESSWLNLDKELSLPLSGIVNGNDPVIDWILSQ